MMRFMLVEIMRKLDVPLPKFKTPIDIHNFLNQELNFPSYYGNNLDALYDILSTIDYEIEFNIFNTDRFPEFIHVFKDAAKVNKNVKINIL